MYQDSLILVNIVVIKIKYNKKYYLWGIFNIKYKNQRV